MRLLYGSRACALLAGGEGEQWKTQAVGRRLTLWRSNSHELFHFVSSHWNGHLEGFGRDAARMLREWHLLIQRHKKCIDRKKVELRATSPDPHNL